MTATSQDELDPPPTPGRDLPPGPVTIGLVVAGGFLIGGPFGLLVAIVALVVWRREPNWLGALVGGLLVVAALGSVLGAWPGPDSLRQGFADDRPWAASAGLAAGVCLLVAVARAARADRRSGPADDVAEEDRPPSVAERVGPWLPVAGIGLGAAVVSLLFSPEPLTAGATAAAEALRAGEGFVRTPGGEPSAYYPPAALVVGALFPAALGLVQAALAAGTALATFVLGTRLTDRRTGVLAGAVAAALPVVWDQPIAGGLAGLALVLALLLAWPDRLTVARAATAGALLVAATLARPEAALAIPVVVAWILVWPGRRDQRATLVGLAALAITVALGLGIWVTTVHDATGAWWPTFAAWPPRSVTSLGGIVVLVVDLAAAVLALDELRSRQRSGTLSWDRHLPWLVLPLLAAAVAAVTGNDHSLWFVVGPLIAVAAASSLARHVLEGHRETATPPVGADA